ncbi:4701_t:CDS:2, partial [Scutellospora calospora]
TLVTKDDMASDDNLKLPTKIKIIINYDSFWNSLTILHKLLYPFCGALDLMQHDKAHLHNVLYTFEWLKDLKKGVWLSYYYKVWFDTEPNCLFCELELYKQQKYSFTKKTFSYFKGDIVLWWSYNSGAAPELCHVDTKVVAMSQLHAKILRAHKKKIKPNY